MTKPLFLAIIHPQPYAPFAVQLEKLVLTNFQQFQYSVSLTSISVLNQTEYISEANEQLLRQQVSFDVLLFLVPATWQNVMQQLPLVYAKQRVAKVCCTCAPNVSEAPSPVLVNMICNQAMSQYASLRKIKQQHR